ncbi:response regulator [Stenotrophomonas sp.]|uniref:response regulator transcription factor n=1 Tax=Stenotrophomonas sp. TaxID=69392 RepID=UPI0028ADD9BC|nr:response regulator [Stenotrophomonas sp.]
MTERAPVVAVVDDEDDVRLALRRLLRSAGFDVLAYESGSEFLRHAARSLPDCVILNLRMSGLSGFDVLATMKERALRIPVVVVTGNDGQESRTEALALGADAYLCKPVDADALIGATQAAIERHRRRRPPPHPGSPEAS